MINEQLLEITKSMPCKQIDVNGKAYIQRYHVGKSYNSDKRENGDYWLHRFLSCDEYPYLHNQPWTSRSIVLCGSVTEALPYGTLVRDAVANPLDAAYSFMGGESHPSDYWITPDTWHRIASVAPETWTLMEVLAEREPHWQFMDENGDIEQIDASPRDWYLRYGARGTNPGDVL